MQLLLAVVALACATPAAAQWLPEEPVSMAGGSAEIDLVVP